MAEKLTEQQQAAVDNRGGRLLVSAAAGSGKTKVLVDRLMKYLTDPDDPANIDDFLIITFTKAAAAELRSKIAKKLSDTIAEDPDNLHLQRQLQRLYMAQISTVHSFCSNLLRRYAYQLDISADFRVAEDNEAAQLRMECMNAVINEAYEALGENADFAALSEALGTDRNDDNLADILLGVYERATCHTNPIGWLDNCAAYDIDERITDISQTDWGKSLMDGILRQLRRYTKLFYKCLNLTLSMPSETRMAGVLQNSVDQLEKLCHCTSWDELYANKNIDFGSYSKTKNADLDIVEQVKTTRKKAIDLIRAALAPCSAPSAKLLQDIRDASPAVHGMTELIKTFMLRYEQEKKRRRWMDYADLEQHTLDLLLGKHRTHPTPLAKEVGKNFREVMVDEYQDANAVQDSIYMALTCERNNCFMVGDVKQSIYQFRLADPDIFLKKYREFDPAETATDPNGRKIILSDNFRSGREILNAANCVFEICMCPEVGGLYYSDAEALHEGVKRGPLDEPAVELYCVDVKKESYAEEAACAAKRINELLDGTHMIRQKDGLRPIRAGDIAILLRAPGTNGTHYVKALAQYGIRCVGGGENLMDAREVQVLRAILQVVQNPRMDIPLATALLSPAFGLRADDLAAIRSANRKCSLYDTLCASHHPAAQEAVGLIRRLRNDAPLLTVSALLDEILEATHLDCVFGAMEDGSKRIENIQVFCQLATNFDGQGAGSLVKFLDHLSLFDKKGINVAQDGSADAVTIISIHSSKGLEYPVVVLGGLAKQFNTDDISERVLSHKKLGIGLDAVDHKHRVIYPTVVKKAIQMKMLSELRSEELRILYVAMTRARDRLLMYYASNNLENTLSQIVSMDNMDCQDVVIHNTSSLGRWVLLAALRRTEAGELFKLSGPNEKATVSDDPWLIRVVEAQEDVIEGVYTDVQTPEIPADLVVQMKQALSFKYPHQAATTAPSKQTATQLKGRQKDTEILENTAVKHNKHFWRTPGDKQASGTDKGTAMHAAMEHLDYGRCGSAAEIQDQLAELETAGKITQQQLELLDSKQLAAFFATSVGTVLRSHPNVLREFKFSILEDGKLLDPELEGEQILLQGVVDCAMIDDDGITVIDFKTDRVDDASVADVANGYRAQLEAYGRSLSRIFEKPIKQKYLYFFRIDRFIAV